MARKSVPVAEVWVKDQAPPTTPIQALMEGVWGEEESTMERADPTPTPEEADVLAQFTDLERDILLMQLEGLSLRDIASLTGLSKWKLHEMLLPELTKRFEALRKKYGSDRGDVDADGT